MNALRALSLDLLLRAFDATSPTRDVPLLPHGGSRPLHGVINHAWLWSSDTRTPVPDTRSIRDRNKGRNLRRLGRRGTPRH